MMMILIASLPQRHHYSLSSSAAIGAPRLYAAPRHGVWLISGHRP
jgi:hypothetical protein